MKKLLAITISFFSIAFTSCITTVQPLVTAENAIEDKRIAGNWSHEDNNYSIRPFFKSALLDKSAAGIKAKSFKITINSEDSLEFSKMYIVSFNNDDYNYHMVAGITKVGTQLFMELTPLVMENEPFAGGDLYQSTMDYLAGSTIAKVNLEAGQLKLQFLDGAFIKEQVLAGKIRLKHEADQLFGTFLITASTSDIHSFLKKYGNDERIFNKTPVVLTRKAG